MATWFNQQPGAWKQPLAQPLQQPLERSRARLRALALWPLAVAAWFAASMAAGGWAAQRLGTLLGALMCAWVLHAHGARRASLAAYGALTVQLTTFVALLLASLPLILYTIGLDCSFSRARLWVGSSCTLRMYDAIATAVLAGASGLALEVAVYQLLGTALATAAAASAAGAVRGRAWGLHRTAPALPDGDGGDAEAWVPLPVGELLQQGRRRYATGTGDGEAAAATVEGAPSDEAV